MAEKNTAGIGFEKQIWDAACVLRGNIDAPLTSLQYDLLLQLEAYERILIEVLHMQGKKYWLEEVAEIIASQREGREKKLACT